VVVLTVFVNCKDKEIVSYCGIVVVYYKSLTLILLFDAFFVLINELTNN